MSKVFLAIVILLVFHTLPAYAQDSSHYPIGQVVEMEGSAYYVSADKKKKSIRTNDPVYLNSVVQTDKNSKVLIMFIDDTQITLAENTELVIDKYIFDPYDAEENEADFSIIEGSFHFLSGMLSKRERPHVKVTTSKGSIGIRGTSFWAGHVDDGYGVLVGKGLVDFRGDWGGVEIPEGQGVFIPDEKKIPEDVKIWPKVREQRALIKTTFKRTGFVEDRIRALRRENVIKRHDYRGHMFPYKKNPFPPGYRPDPDDFFTEEFQELRDRQ